MFILIKGEGNFKIFMFCKHWDALKKNYANVSKEPHFVNTGLACQTSEPAAYTPGVMQLVQVDFYVKMIDYIIYKKFKCNQRMIFFIKIIF